jgi:hypothetical protein
MGLRDWRRVGRRREERGDLRCRFRGGEGVLVGG